VTQSKGRIAGRFEDLAAAGRCALIPYVVAGDPFADFTVDLMHKLVAAGADIIELGVPFSDPMAEGPVIQRGHERALEKGVSLRKALAMVAEFRQQDQATPVLLMGYANPVIGMGFEKFSELAAESGLDGLLTVDMPPEEVKELNVQLKLRGIDNIFLVAPTTPRERIKKIAEVATGFVYYVSLKGVTGAANLDIAAVSSRLAEIREFSDLPLAVGFGIKDPASAAAVARVAQGVVVGSALVSLMADSAEAGKSPAEVADIGAQMLAGLRAGMDAL
jgi:tryptophan synthase alpha chain